MRVNPPLTRPYPKQVPSQAVDRWATAGKQKPRLIAREHQVQRDTPSTFGTRRLGSRLARSAGLFQMRGPRKQYGRDRDETAPPRMTPGKARVTEGNRPERRSVGSGSLESRRRRPARWGFGGALGIALGCRCRDGSMWWDDIGTCHRMPSYCRCRSQGTVGASTSISRRILLLRVELQGPLFRWYVRWG